MAIRHIWSWRIGAILAITLMSALATGYIYQGYVATQKTNALASAQSYREGLAVFYDLSRLKRSLEPLAKGETSSLGAVSGVTDALDFVFVRISQLEILQKSAQPQSQLAPLIATLREIVEFGDTSLVKAGNAPEWFLGRMDDMISSATTLALNHADSQFHHQAAAIELQTQTLFMLTVGAVSLLLLFSLIAGASVYLFEREKRASKSRQAAEQKVAYLADFDALTGLPKRNRFRSVGAEHVQGNDRALVILIDVDDFKFVNDTYGHATGDAVLRHVADCIDHVAEAYRGVAGRLGGDEFAVAVPGPISSMRAAQICEEIISSVNTPVDHDNIQIVQKVSLGVAIASEDVEMEIDAPNGEDDLLSRMMKNADIALYQSKDEGKNTYSFFDARLAEVVARRRFLEQGITEALASGGFHLNLQPQVNLQTGAVIGFEALARWTLDGKPVSPGEFIPIAEDSGQVVDIDLFALNEAAAMLRRWLDLGLPPVKLSTNLSALHFRNEKIVEEVARVLKVTGLPPKLLTLEITESVMIESVQNVVRTLQRLRGLGVSLALDDFGTGYSSLAYLRKLPIDFIKIDQSFVRDLEESLETQIVMQSLSGLIQGLNRKIVVEGIETEGQAALIRQMGCNFGQGYLFGRPMTPEAAENLLARAIQRKTGT